MTAELVSVLEWIVFTLNVVFLVLLIRENIWCWVFGIVASALSVSLFYQAQLYSETLLYSVYVVLGLYAWITWHRNSLKQQMPILKKGSQFHLIAIVIGIAVWSLLGFFFMLYTDSKLPWADAFTTAFAFVATYLEAKKILHHWVYWIVVNLFSIWLYQSRDLPILAMMMLMFGIFSVAGLLIWKKQYQDQSRLTTN
ncbi:MAG: nicotinamide mononucleotide transporter [Bacteroidia bacterium]|jgi:nicotinamide mononucleotide transporter